MTTILLAIGLVLAAEGLVFALAPKRIEDALKMLSEMPVETRRIVGLASLAVGVLIIWIAKAI